MSTEHRRPLLAFVAVFAVAMLVVASAARSDVFREFVRDRTVDIVAATALDLVGEPEPRLLVAAPQVDSRGNDAAGKPAPGKAKGHDKHQGKAKGHAKHQGQGKGHDKAKHPGKAKGQDKHQGKAKGHAKHPGKGKGHAKPGR